MNFRAACAAATGFALALPAHAHVKWFAAYIVEAPPQKIGETGLEVALCWQA